MPALKTPLEASLPTHQRRRTWSRPELTSHSLLVLTLDCLYLAPAAGNPKPETLAAVESGVDLGDIFGPLAVVIRTSAIRRLELDLLTNSLIVEYGGGQAGLRRQRITFANPQAADVCFTRVWRRLGDDVRLSPYRGDTGSLIRGPILLLLVALVVTAALVMLLNVATDREAVAAGAVAPPASVLESLGTWLSWLNWRVVCAIGGVAAAVSQVWLYRRLTTPPVSLEVVRP